MSADARAPALPAASEPNMHAAIMNLPCKVPANLVEEVTREHFILPQDPVIRAYRVGHRDARHAAAELVAPPLPVASEPASGAVQVLREALPERRRLPERPGSTYFRGLGWNECLDEIVRRNAGATVMEAGSDPYPAQAAAQAELIDLKKLEQAMAWMGLSAPSGEILGWWVGREVNRLVDAVLEQRTEFQKPRAHNVMEGEPK